MEPAVSILLAAGLVYAAGFITGWRWARRTTRYMLGGPL